MKKVLTALVTVVLAGSAMALGLGDGIPMGDVKMKNVDGNEVSIAAVKGTKGTLVVFTCNHCPYVKAWEGRLAELADFSPGHVVQDNNLLQASRAHRRRVFAMLAKQRRAAVFAGGLDARWVDDQLAEELRGLRIDSVFLAADVDAAIAPLERALKRLAFLPRRKLRVYVMLGYAGESLASAEARLEAVWELGALPFAQLYQPPDRWIPYSRSWRDLARTWSRPAAMFTLHAHAPSRVVNTRVFTDQR